ncbi:MAG: RimK family alpha-L-glutamate ligase [Archangium sp.]|nr:RimK family alpha-L-glutamate ligase [Archangium sp.]
MRLCILSRRRSLYSTSRLVEAAEKAGARPVVLDTLRCALVVAKHASRLVYRGENVDDLSVVIPRIGTSITGYGMAVVNHLDAMGIPVLNGASAIARSRDKVRCLQLLAAGGIDVPRTAMVHDARRFKALVDEVGGLPCIIKLLRGTQGVGVMIANTLTEARTIVQTFTELGHDVCLQEFIAESKGRDVRALVVGDRVVGAMRRTAKHGEFRSNIHRGGEGQPITLEPKYAETAIEAARLVGLDICGVDMLEAESGPRVMELNSSPGFEGLEQATGADIAGAMVSFAMQRATAARRPAPQP